MKQNDFTGIARLLHHVRTDTQVKLLFGANKRTELKLQLESGQKADHYRLEWIGRTRDEMARWLSDKAKDFNKEHPYDACSVMDLMDVTASTLSLLKKINGGKN